MGELLATPSSATVPPFEVTETGWTVNTGAPAGGGLTWVPATTIVNGKMAEIPVPTKEPPLPPVSRGLAKPWTIRVKVPAMVGVPVRTGVVVTLAPLDMPVHVSTTPGLVASRLPGPEIEIAGFSAAWIDIPGGSCPVNVQEATFIVLVILKTSGVILVPTVALKSGRAPVGFAVRLDARIVAPAIESTAPRAAREAAADLRIVPKGDAVMISSAVTTRRATGVRCRSATRVAVDIFIQAQRRWRWLISFMVRYLGSNILGSIAESDRAPSCSRSRCRPRPCLRWRPRARS